MCNHLLQRCGCFLEVKWEITVTLISISWISKFEHISFHFLENIYIFSVGLCVHRNQFNNALLPPCGFQTFIAVSRLGSMHLYPLSHSPSSKKIFFDLYSYSFPFYWISVHFLPIFKSFSILNEKHKYQKCSVFKTHLHGGHSWHFFCLF